MTLEFEEIANESVRETIETFFKYPSGFHGDTGLQHFLYHRVLSKAGRSIVWESEQNAQVRTLLFQSEVYTKKTYCGTGKGSGPGRFDMAFVEPPTVTIERDRIISERLRPLIAFEVGRNKGIEKMGAFHAVAEVRDPKPGDAAKIIRDLRFGGLRTGYLLEFFDQSSISGIRKAQALAKGLQDFLQTIEAIDCRIAVCLLTQGGNPLTWFYPDSWGNRVGQAFDTLDIRKDYGPSDGRSGNRISCEDFLLKCGECGKAIQEAIRERYSTKLKLLYGKKSMTVNLRPKGRLFRIGNKIDIHGECVYEISDVIANSGKANTSDLIESGKIYIPEKKTEELVHKILRLLSKTIRL